MRKKTKIDGIQYKNSSKKIIFCTHKIARQVRADFPGCKVIDLEAKRACDLNYETFKRIFEEAQKEKPKIEVYAGSPKNYGKMTIERGTLDIKITHHQTEEKPARGEIKIHICDMKFRKEFTLEIWEFFDRKRTFTIQNVRKDSMIKDK